jgi:hypothetical protein
VSLAKINRQRDPEYRAAVMEMAASRVTQGLDRLEQKGWIHEEKSAYLVEAPKRYLELGKFGKTLVTERGEPHVLAVGPTHAEIRAFTADVREAMREAGALSGPTLKRQAFIPHDTRGSLAIPVYDVDGKLWSAQYVNSDGSKRFARESRKDACFHVVGAEGSGADVLRYAHAIVVAEGYATAVSLKELYSQGDDKRQAAFVAAFDAGTHRLPPARYVTAFLTLRW